MWTQKYGCIENGDKLICILCTDIIAAKNYNIDQLFSRHKDVNEMANEDQSKYIANEKKLLKYENLLLHSELR